MSIIVSFPYTLQLRSLVIACVHDLVRVIYRYTLLSFTLSCIFIKLKENEKRIYKHRSVSKKVSPL